jgi:hypothetical protein
MKTLEANWPLSQPRLRALVVTVTLHAAFGACVFRVAATLAADQSLEDRFLKEAPAKWLEYRQVVARHTEGRTKGAFENALRQKYFWDESFALNIEEKAARAKVVWFEKGQATKVEAFNSKYRFRLAAGRGGQWVIDRLRDGARDVPADLIGRNPKFPLLMGEEGTLLSALGSACLGQTLYAAWLPRIAESSDFHLIRATELKGERGLVKVEFKFEPAGTTGGGASVRSGTVVLDARRYWLIREADTQAAFMVGSVKRGLVPLRGTLTIRNKIVDGKLPVPYVSHQVITEGGADDSEGKPWKSTIVSDVEMHDAPNIDARQFTLSAYGLPEPAAK